MQVEMPNSPDSCQITAQVQLGEGATLHTLTLTNASEDSGPLALDFAAGAEIAVRVIRAANCAGNPNNGGNGNGSWPQDANVLVQYRVR
jgi:hypothetical protein